MTVFTNKATKQMVGINQKGYDTTMKGESPGSVRLPTMGVLATPNAHKLLRGGVPKGILETVAKGEHPNFDAFLNNTPFFRGKKGHLKKVALKEYGHLYSKKTGHIILSVDEMMEADANKTLQNTARELRASCKAQKEHSKKIKKAENAYFKRHPKAAKKIKAARTAERERADALDEEDKYLFEQAVSRECIDVLLNAKTKRTIGGISVK